MPELSRNQIITLAAIFTAAFLTIMGIMALVVWMYPPAPLQPEPVESVSTDMPFAVCGGRWVRNCA